MESRELHNKSWEIFNQAFSEQGVVRESMQEAGKSFLVQAEVERHTKQRDSLYAKLDEQSALIDTALRLKNVRAELKEIQHGN